MPRERARASAAVPSAAGVRGACGLSAAGVLLVLESAAALDVTDERTALVPTTRAEATAAMESFAASGRVSNQLLTVVVVGVSRTSWVSGFRSSGL